MRKINIILIFTLIGVFLTQDILYALRPPINTNQILRNSQKPEFVYYIRDENWNLLKEPCGFPGYWTVEVKVPIKEDTNAGVQRMVKSFSLSMQASQREDVKRAKFTVVDNLPEDEKGVLVKKNDFYIKSSKEFGIEIVIKASFLKKGISEQRAIFSSIAEKLPKQADLIMPKAIKIQRSGNKIKKVAVVNMQEYSNNKHFSILNSTSLVLASLLRQSNYDVKIITDSLRTIDKDLEDIDMVCLSAYDQELSKIGHLSAILKEKKPNIIIAVGGPMMTIIPEHVFAHLPDVDIFYRGEAEAGFIDLLKDLEDLNPKTLSGISGITVRAGNTCYFNDFLSINRMTEEQLNNRPFDFSMVDETNANGGFSFMTSLGCPYACIFCATGGGKKHRAMAPENVIEVARRYQNRLEELEASGATVHPDAWKVVLSDDDFLRDPKRAVKILELWKQAGLRLKITSFQSTMQSFLTKKIGGGSKANIDLIDKIASFKDIFTYEFKIQIGTDALINPEIKRLHKGPYDEKAIEEVIAAFEKKDIINQHFLILTNADSSLGDLIRTLIKASIFDIKYPHSIFYANHAIIAHTGTSAVNNLIEASRESLIRDRWGVRDEDIADFREYDFYPGPDIINPEKIPQGIFDEIGNFFEGQSLLGRFPKYKMLESLSTLVTAINEDMEDFFSSDLIDLSLEGSRKWSSYRDILENVFTGDIKELTALLVNKTNLPPGIDEFMFMRACMGFNLIGYKLRALKARYENPSMFDTLVVHEGVGSSL